MIKDASYLMIFQFEDFQTNDEIEYEINNKIETVNSKPDKTPVHEVWAEVFSLDEKNQSNKNFSISRCLADLHDEVELVRIEMQRLG